MRKYLVTYIVQFREKSFPYYIRECRGYKSIFSYDLLKEQDKLINDIKKDLNQKLNHPIESDYLKIDYSIYDNQTQ